MSAVEHFHDSEASAAVWIFGGGGDKKKKNTFGKQTHNLIRFPTIPNLI